MASSLPLAQHPALQALLDKVDVNASHAALSQLASEYAGTDLVKDESVLKVVAQLGDAEESSGNRLINVSSLLALAAAKREFKKLIEAPLRRLLSRPPERLSHLEDVNARAKVAIYFAQKRLPWLPEYLATEIVAPGFGDKTRSAMVLGLIRNSPIASRALELIRVPFTAALTRPGILDREAMGLSRALFSAFRAGMEKHTVELSGDFGATLASFTSAVRHGHFSGERDEQARMGIAVEVGAIANIATALNPALLTDGALFGAIEDSRALIVKARNSPPVLRHVSTQSTRIKGAMTLLARQGVWDHHLFINLESVVGSREAALRITKSILRDYPGLPSNIQTALSEGALSAVHANTAESEDLAVAVLLLRASEYQGATADKINADAASSLAVEAVALARGRGLEVIGAPGETVDYDPVLHRLAEPTNKIGKVSIVVPAVVQRREDKGFSVVLAAVTRPLP